MSRPSAIVRVRWYGQERLAGQGEWVPTKIASDITDQNCHGTLVPLTEQDAARLVEAWRPHPAGELTRHYAWMSEDGRPRSLIRAWEQDGGVLEESYRDGRWDGGHAVCAFEQEAGRIEVDGETAERLIHLLHRRMVPVKSSRQELTCYAIVRDDRNDVSTAHALVRSWGGTSLTATEEKFEPKTGEWARSMILYRIGTARDDSEEVPISEAVAEELRHVLVARHRAWSEGREPETPRPLGTWTRLGKVTFPLVDDSTLDALERAGDPLADAAVAELYSLGEVRRVNEVLAGFAHNGDDVPDGLPQLLRRYFGESAALPQWADHEAIEGAQRSWALFAPHFATVLCCYVLPLRYGSASTSRRTRRGMESTRLLQDVMGDGGLLAPHGRGVRTLQKVRLLHAATRYLQDGLPANQVDLAATAGTLSVALPLGLNKTFIGWTERERDELFHLWSAAGHLLGVDPVLTPRGYDDAATLVDALLRRGRAESAEGRDLVKALERRVRTALPGALRHLFSSEVRYFCGHDLSVLLGVDGLKRTTPHEAILKAAGLPEDAQLDGRVWERTRSALLGKALLAADREDLTLPTPR
ncbi:oxygenase MpaB family protein [Lentzea cavernae]|uniref:oxygenase MpaB family protein n=1 Tax=Lentzea cavernae TaxID=2020703 RepID=UPI00174C2905|nr:oxygenase MpaB family protein [Lentzea cavernae]